MLYVLLLKFLLERNLLVDVNCGSFCLTARCWFRLCQCAGPREIRERQIVINKGKLSLICLITIQRSNMFNIVALCLFYEVGT